MMREYAIPKEVCIRRRELWEPQARECGIEIEKGNVYLYYDPRREQHVVRQEWPDCAGSNDL
jgi:hypothetical protein